MNMKSRKVGEQMKEFKVLETVTIVREGYIKAKSLKDADEEIDSFGYFEDLDIDMSQTEEYIDNREVLDEQG